MDSVAVIGAGLAGSEAALVLARMGIRVELFEMRPLVMTPAHKTDLPAELVCSNSFKAQGIPGAHALLKDELTILESPLLGAARATGIPAGSALAVDREAFSKRVSDALNDESLITLTRREMTGVPREYPLCIIAAGPLVSDALAGWLQGQFSRDALFFHDAIAPVIAAESVDMSKAFFADRYGSAGGDYLNCPFSREQYELFYRELTGADSIAARPFENVRYFEACLPVEVIAKRGIQSLAFGPLKPIGLVDPATGKRPYAVCQLRAENREKTAYNMVGFQTRLAIGEQKRVFRMIPGLENAEFLRFGSIHRNTYLDSPRLLSDDLSFRTMNSVLLAGQLCGNEGYTESIATGHMAALFVRARLLGRKLPPPPRTTALGALLHHVVHSEEKRFTPAAVNFGLVAPLETARKKQGKREKIELLHARALGDLGAWKEKWLAENPAISV